MQNSFTYILFITLTSLAISLQSCKDLLNDPDSGSRHGIVFGDNIEGVKVWDDSSTVINKLGQPSSIAIGDWAGYWFEYKTDAINYTRVTLSATPLLGNGVISMSVESPYKGKSKEGIGIGSDRDYVINELGNPNSTNSDSSGITDTYKYNFTYFSIAYADGKAKRISMFVLVN